MVARNVTFRLTVLAIAVVVGAPLLTGSMLGCSLIRRGGGDRSVVKSSGKPRSPAAEAFENERARLGADSGGPTIGAPGSGAYSADALRNLPSDAMAASQGEAGVSAMQLSRWGGADEARFDGDASSAATHNPAINIFGEVNGVPGSSAQYGATEGVMQVSFAGEGADFDPRVDRSGQYVVYASTQHSRSADIYLKSVDGRTVTQLTDDPADDMMPAWSPDNSQIAFTSNRHGNWDVFMMSSGGGQAVQITSDPAPEIHPSWSPDGRFLVYCKRGEASGRWEMWLTEVGNTNVRRFLDYGLFPEWSPDPAANKIVYQKARERGSRYFGIWTLDVIDGEARTNTEIAGAVNAACINPTWSPDGTMIAFATVTEPDRLASGDKPDWSDIWVVNIDGTDKIQLTSGQFTNLQPTWGNDGRIYFVSNRNGVENIWALAPARAILTATWPNSAGARKSEVAGVPTADR